MTLYAIVTTKELTASRIAASENDNASTLRASKDGRYYLLKLKFNTFTGLPDVFNGLTLYTHAEILHILDGGGW